jgi:hypothetical protein
LDKLIPALKNSIFTEGVTDTLVDIGEIGLDSILDLTDEVLSEIPILKTIRAGAKFGQNLRDRNLMKETLAFVVALNEGQMDSEKVARHREKLKNSRYAEKELSRVLLLLDSFLDSQKAIWLAKFYKAYVTETISWDMFVEFSEIISRSFLSDIERLQHFKRPYQSIGGDFYIDDSRKIITDDKQPISLERLTANGLLHREISAPEINQGTLQFSEQGKFYLTDTGALFLQIAFDREI